MGHATYAMNREKRRIFLQAARNGQPWQIAIRLVGIPDRTGRDWRAKGEAGIQPYARLYEAFLAAQAEYLEKQQAMINESAEAGNWIAAAWNLERREPGMFGMVAALRQSADAETGATSQAARLASLAQAWGATHPDEPAPELAALMPADATPGLVEIEDDEG